MNNQERAFVRMPDDEIDTIHLRNSVSKISGIPSVLIPMSEIERFEGIEQKIAMGEDLGSEEFASRLLYRKYIPSNDRLSPVRQERLSVEKYSELLNQLSRFNSSCIERESFGNHLFLYLYTLSKLRDEQPEKSKINTLLVGAIDPTTIHEYGVTVRQLFPDAHCMVIDPEGETTPAASKDRGIDFLYGDGFRLPFQGSQDIIFTNMLISYLGTHGGTGDGHFTAKEFSKYAEAVKDSISPGGYISALEQVTDGDAEGKKREILGDLNDMGYVESEVEVTNLSMPKMIVYEYFGGTSTKIEEKMIKKSVLPFLYISAKQPCE